MSSVFSETTSSARDWWLTAHEEERWLEVSFSWPLVAMGVFGVCCWVFIIACRCARPAKAVRITLDIQVLAVNVVALLYSAFAVGSGAWMIVTRPTAAACAARGRLFCFHPVANTLLESLLGFYAFDAIFSAFKTRSWLMPFGGGEDVLVLAVLMLQRIYPCIAVVQLLPWLLACHASLFFWALDALLDRGYPTVSRRPAWVWNSLFVNEGARLTAALLKFLVYAVLAYSTASWLWNSPLQHLPLPHGLGQATWYYSYIVSSALCFAAFIAFKQLQQGARLSMVKLRQFEAAVRGQGRDPATQQQHASADAEGSQPHRGHRGGSSGSGKRRKP